MTEWIKPRLWRAALAVAVIALAIQLIPDRPAEAAPQVKIAFINVADVVENHPKMSDVMRQVANFRRTKIDEVKKKFGDSNEKVDLNSEEGQRMVEETSLALQEVEKYKDELIAGIVGEVKKAALELGREVQESQGIEIIISSMTWVSSSSGRTFRIEDIDCAPW